MKMLGQLVGWVQADGAGLSEGVRSAGGVGLLLSGCKKGRVKMLGQLEGWVQVDGAGSSEDVRSIGGWGYC